MKESYIGMNKPTEDLKNQATTIFNKIKEMEEKKKTEEATKLREEYRKIAEKLKNMKSFNLKN